MKFLIKTCVFIFMLGALNFVVSNFNTEKFLAVPAICSLSFVIFHLVCLVILRECEEKQLNISLVAMIIIFAFNIIPYILGNTILKTEIIEILFFMMTVNAALIAGFTTWALDGKEVPEKNTNSISMSRETRRRLFYNNEKF